MKILHLLPQVILLTAAVGSSAHGAGCLAPARPYIPEDVEAGLEYVTLIQRDVETYFRGIEAYFRCLEVERARALVEAREVSQAFAIFWERTRQQ